MMEILTIAGGVVLGIFLFHIMTEILIWLGE